MGGRVSTETIPSAVAFGLELVKLRLRLLLKTGHRIDREEVDKDRTLCDENRWGLRDHRIGFSRR